MRTLPVRTLKGDIIRLTPNERDILRTLREVRTYFKLDTSFRVAGGWVRDKLLGKDSDDMDIAMDNLTGRQFEEYLYRFRNEVPELSCLWGEYKTHIVQETPGVKLETVAVELFGRKIDLGNLRTETYGDTRVPETKFGTPQQDAERRDLTINALFLNIDTFEIEDYVGGLDDLDKMLLRTPMEARLSFCQDPLRVLRTVRFYSVLDKSKIVPDTMNGLGDPEVHEAYRKKVFAERAGPELLKLLAGKQSARAIRLLFDRNLHKLAFDTPTFRELKDLRMDQKNDWHAHDLLEHTMQVVEHLSDLMEKANYPEDLRIKMLFAAIFHDFGKAHPNIQKPRASNPQQMSYKGHEEKSSQVADEILTSICVPIEHRSFVKKIIDLHMRPHCESWSNRSIGHFLRDCEIPGQDSKDVWRHVLLHAMADEMAKGKGDLAEDLHLKMNHRRQIEEFVNRPAAPSYIKPLLDGHALMAMFPGIKTNKVVDGKNFIKHVSEMLLEAQAEGLSSAEEAKAFVERQRSSIEDLYKAAPNPSA